MALEAVLESIRVRLCQVLSDAGEKEPSYEIGADKLAASDAPNRIVWVPRGGAITAPAQQGGDGIGNPSTLAQRNVLCEAHIWCDDVLATEKLMNHLAAAIHAVMPGSWVPRSENWDTGQTSATNAGVLCVFGVELRIPLTREPDPTAVIVAMPITDDLHPQQAEA